MPALSTVLSYLLPLACLPLVPLLLSLGALALGAKR